MLVVGTIDLNLIIQCFYHTRIKKAFVGNKNNLEVKFDSRNSIFDSDNKKYSINLYLIPKANGTSNLEVIFKDEYTIIHLIDDAGDGVDFHFGNKEQLLNYFY